MSHSQPAWQIVGPVYVEPPYWPYFICSGEGQVLVVLEMLVMVMLVLREEVAFVLEVDHEVVFVVVLGFELLGVDDESLIVVVTGAVEVEKEEDVLADEEDPNQS